MQMIIEVAQQVRVSQDNIFLLPEQGVIPTKEKSGRVVAGISESRIIHHDGIILDDVCGIADSVNFVDENDYVVW